MNQLRTAILVIMVSCCLISSCGNEGEVLSESLLIGTWFHESSYNAPPNYQTQYQYSTIAFSSNKTGVYVFQSTAGVHEHSTFAWKKSGNSVTCSGVLLSKDGVDANWNPTFTISGNKLVHGSREYYKR